ncbi:hypothetical protein FDP41_012187 [Naegleria fowleri]|uniref:t-SNARE coiled-coil homology domain-containing protein n=2 Tax=Naegleria fowleri TaxID=5763 RepID=A0A6A5C6W8_NAEFO|nr:uncharacterized protein FDP41_012187 [Naegleria fowleri]KAF0981530.1 hypothetical protein FDP41_012187 [Naegleria fowleri]CAG4714836.1 unnamed protein product [Naegleria fowleri]
MSPATVSTSKLKSSLFGSSSSSQNNHHVSESSKSNNPVSPSYRDRTISEQEDDLQESEFDQVAMEMGKSSQALKQIAGEMRDEVTSQVSSLKRTTTTASETQSGMGGIMKHMKQVFEVRTWKQMWQLVGIIVVTFFIVYYSIRISWYFLMSSSTEAKQ